jgi:hypothetical protein
MFMDVRMCECIVRMKGKTNKVKKSGIRPRKPLKKKKKKNQFLDWSVDPIGTYQKYLYTSRRIVLLCS